MIKLKKTASLALLSVLLASPVFAVADEFDAKIKEQEQKIESLEQKQADAETQLAQIAANVSQVEDEINVLMASKTKEEERFNQLQEEIKGLKEVIAKRDQKLKEQAVSVQTNQSADNFLEAIISADSLNEAFGRVMAVSTIVDANNNILKEQQADKQQLEVLSQESETRLRTIEEHSAQLKEKQQELVEVQLDQEVLINEIQSSVTTEKKQKAKFVKQKEEAERKRQEQLKALEEQRAKEAAAREAAKKAEEAQLEKAQVEQEKQAQAEKEQLEQADEESTATPSEPVRTPVQAPVSGNAGWASPVSSISVSSPYGMRANPVGPGMEFHNGIDLVGSSGTPIFAAKAGTVVQTGFDAGGGNYIIIEHSDGYYSHYLHLSSIGVSDGQSVSQGETIGGMGTTGSSTGVHLHFGVGKGIWSGYVDPTSFIM